MVGAVGRKQGFNKTITTVSKPSIFRESATKSGILANHERDFGGSLLMSYIANQGRVLLACELLVSKGGVVFKLCLNFGDTPSLVSPLVPVGS